MIRDLYNQCSLKLRLVMLPRFNRLTVHLFALHAYDGATDTRIGATSLRREAGRNQPIFSD